MEIIIGGSLAVLKKNTSFEFISENRLFTGSDSYTLTITFPLRGCPENIAIFGHIHRADVAKSKIVFDCELLDKAFYRSGTITVTEVSDTEIKTQFLEGRSEQNFDDTFDDIYLNELDLGYAETRVISKLDIDTAFLPYPTNNFVPLPWVNNYSGNIQNAINYSEEQGEYIEWNSTTSTLTFQPYLLHILHKICEAVGYSYDFSALEDSEYKYLLFCNTLPSTWEAWNFAIALPHWTLTEFFEQLEYFLFGEFDINHRTKKISFAFSSKLVSSAGTVQIDETDIVDSYTVEVTTEDESKYMASTNLKYADNDANMWAYYSCDWYIRTNKANAITYDTMTELIVAAKGLQISGVYSDSRGTMYCRGYVSGSNGNKLFYCKENDTYFVMYCYQSLQAMKSGDNTFYKYYNRLLPVNQFGECFVSDDADDTELKIVPAWIEGTDSTYGNVLFLDCGEMGDNSSWTVSSSGTTSQSSGSGVTFGGRRPSTSTSGKEDVDYDAGDLAQGDASYNIAKGEKDKTEGYFDVIYVGFWDGNTDDFMPYQPHPIIDTVEVTTDFTLASRTNQYSLRLNADMMTGARSVMKKIDGTKKYHFSFLSSSIPSPRATFYIHGARYICEKITATFHECGMSQLLKGIFYRVADD